MPFIPHASWEVFQRSVPAQGPNWFGPGIAGSTCKKTKEVQARDTNTIILIHGHTPGHRLADYRLRRSQTNCQTLDGTEETSIDKIRGATVSHRLGKFHTTRATIVGTTKHDLTYLANQMGLVTHSLQCRREHYHAFVQANWCVDIGIVLPYPVPRISAGQQ